MPSSTSSSWGGGSSSILTISAAVVIGAAAIYHLSEERFQEVSAIYFGWSDREQMAVVGLVVSILLVVVGLCQGSSKSASSSWSAVVGKKKKTATDYPLAAIRKAGPTDTDKFKAVYPMLRDEIVSQMKDVRGRHNDMNDEACDWVRDMIDYNVPGGKLNRGTTVLAVYRVMQKGKKPLTDFEIARASVLGWTIEFLQAFFLVADDVMDESKTRRGQPCWYKVPRVGLVAINDSFLLESFVFGILREHFGNEPYYLRLVELLMDVVQKTEFGQLLDLTSQPAGEEKQNVILNRFTMDRYKLIVKYKTAFYSFYLPVSMGMILSGIRDQRAYDLARQICCKMGEYFQIQDDYLDCFGDPAVIGKVGTDIQDNKCSWLVVQALERCTSKAQRKVLEDNYGVWDDGKVAKIKQLYKDLDLPKVFSRYEEESYKSIQADLDKVTLMPRDVFEILLKKIYKRSK